MKNTPTVLWISLALAVGFSLAWFLKPAAPAPRAEEPTAAAESGEETIWTCSMHPQIRQNEPGKCPICGMDLIPLDEMGEASADDPLTLEMTPEAVKLAQVQTTIVGQTGRAEKQIQLTGKIQADERRTASQVAHIPGRIEALFVTFTGESIQQGQKLATVYSPELITAQRELLEALAYRELNPDLVEAARNKLRYWKIPEEAIQSIEKSGKIQETFTLKADVSGVVTRRRVAVGDYVKPGQILFDVVDLERLWVLFDAYEEDLASIRIGDVVRFSVPVLPGREFSTRITFIDPVINEKTRTASLRGEVANIGYMLKPEMFVRGTVQPRLEAAEHLLVPKSAVLWTGPRSVVWVKVPGKAVPTFQFREVELGEAAGDSYLVKSGLQPGEEVVTYGNFAIDAAAQLNAKRSMMNDLVQVKGTEHAGPDYRAETPAEFKKQLDAVARAYATVKDALVESDPLKSSEAATAFLQSLEKVDMSLLQGPAHLFWMDRLEALRTHGELLAQAADVEAQRQQFGFLSQALIQAVQAFGIEGDTLYVQHCPMAFDNQGGDWLSLEEKIQNPYFGEQMLTCGKITQTIRPGEVPAAFQPVQSTHHH